ncbi:MAG: hypothetical protein LBD88_01855 [Candidatus Peribacteria bacterium]|jgi:hypothetical protein|nr:hypothetical protein [Candidatus Peribacteria bacterium]
MEKKSLFYQGGIEKKSLLYKGENQKKSPLDKGGQRGVLTWFYSSDYSDILALNDLTNFVEEFVPFFEKLENAMMEIRTKSNNIKPLFNL